MAVASNLSDAQPNQNITAARLASTPLGQRDQTPVPPIFTNPFVISIKPKKRPSKEVRFTNAKAPKIDYGTDSTKSDSQGRVNQLKPLDVSLYDRLAEQCAKEEAIRSARKEVLLGTTMALDDYFSTLEGKHHRDAALRIAEALKYSLISFTITQHYNLGSRQIPQSSNSSDLFYTDYWPGDQVAGIFKATTTVLVTTAETPAGESPATFLLGPKGSKAFQKLVEDTSPYNPPPPRYRLKPPRHFPLSGET